jgi:hypothetical protein
MFYNTGFTVCGWPVATPAGRAGIRTCVGLGVGVATGQTAALRHDEWDRGTRLDRSFKSTRVVRERASPGWL